MRLKGKVVLITGAAGGMGRAISELFAWEGATVFAGDLAPPDMPHFGGIVSLALDVTREQDWQKAVDTVIEMSGRLDVLINGAGIISYEQLHELDLTAWMETIAVNQTGVFLGMREAVGVMRRQRSGSIVNISSVWGGVAVGGAYACHAAKGAVRNMSQNAAMTYVADGIRINSVYSGVFHAQAPGHNGCSIDPAPMKCGSTPVAVAHGCLFLASDEAMCVTGAELAVDGYLAQ
jgi:NAD(P)-dependent dehydrogenase (short-subunit alcohol dehydrogenase family)